MSREISFRKRVLEGVDCFAGVVLLSWNTEAISTFDAEQRRVLSILRLPQILLSGVFAKDWLIAKGIWIIEHVNWKTGVQKLSTWPLVRQAHAFLSKIPGIGMLVTKFTRVTLPKDARIWVHIGGGHGKGLELHVAPRFETHYLSGEYEKDGPEAA